MDHSANGEDEMLNPETPAQVSISILSTEEWLQSLMGSGVEQSTHGYGKPKIQKVPWVLREVECNKTCYDPIAVSIGPYHHGKPQLQQIEKLKTTMARQLVMDSGRNIDEFYNQVKEVAKEAIEGYAEGSTSSFNDEAFTKMMFLDGCFICFFISCIVMKKHERLSMIKHPPIAFVEQDLFLLENQLPFSVLRVLMSLRFPGEENWMGYLQSFVSVRTGRRAGGSGYVTIVGQEEPLHLLDLLRIRFMGKIIGTSAAEIRNYDGWKGTVHSVKELKALGVNFKTKKHKAVGVNSETNEQLSILDIDFENGELFLPSLWIYDQTKTIFLNLIAFEACHSAPDHYAITSYVCFMNTLIDCTDSVKDLRADSVLYNYLGSDQHVVNLFKESVINLKPNPFAYLTVKHDIASYPVNKPMRIKRRIWMAELMQTYLSSPWKTVAVIAALYAIVLTTIQTYFAIFPRS